MMKSTDNIQPTPIFSALGFTFATTAGLLVLLAASAQLTVNGLHTIGLAGPHKGNNRSDIFISHAKGEKHKTLKIFYLTLENNGSLH